MAILKICVWRISKDIDTVLTLLLFTREKYCYVVLLNFLFKRNKFYFNELKLCFLILNIKKKKLSN